MAKKGRAKPTPRILFAGARLGGRGGLKAGMPRRFREVFDDLKSPAGNPGKYDHAAIIAVAEDAAKLGIDLRKAWFFNRVREMCKQRRPAVKTPANNRTMRRILKDMYERKKVTGAK